jgi:CelD/BcsL family acetyltransferase involved in cellulose biosynthesis
MESRVAPLNDSTLGMPPLPQASTDLTFRVFRGLEGLREIADAWQRVLESIERPELFHRFEWYEVALKTWPAAAERTYFVVAYRDRLPVAVCPLEVLETRQSGLPVRALTTPDPHALSYSDFVCAGDLHPDLVTSLLEELRTSNEIHWDLLILPKCFQTAAVAPASERLAKASGVVRYRWDVCFYFPCDQGAGAFYERMSGGQRRHLKKSRRTLGQHGAIELVSTRDPALLPDYLDQFLSLEASGWKGAQGTAIKQDPTLVRFYASLVAEFGRSGDCEINLLRVDGHNVAGDFALLAGGTWNQLKMAYDEEFGRHSPGYLLLEGIFGRLCDDARVHTANILTGAEWAARLYGLELEVWRIVARNRALKSTLVFQTMKLSRLARERASPWAARLRTALRKSSSPSS